MRERNEIVAWELTISRYLLEDARREIAALAAAKYEVEQNVITYQEDVATVHKVAHDISIGAEQKLNRDIGHAKAEVRRETLEELGARGIGLSADLKEARAMEERLMLLISPHKGKNYSDEY